jgi:hypothetical protein
MSSLDNTAKTISEKCISIPVVSCAGRKGTLTTSDAGTYLKLDGSDYWDVDDGYLHIDGEALASSVGHVWQSTEAEIHAVICKINTLYFAGKIKVDNDLFRIGSRSFNVGLLPLVEMVKSFFSYPEQLMEWISGAPRKWWKYRLSLRKVRFFRREYVETVERMDIPPLGASWQNYYSEGEKWLKEAESLKGGKIYLA